MLKGLASGKPRGGHPEGSIAAPGGGPAKTIELHDRPYNFWRRRPRRDTLDEPEIEGVIARVPDLGLFVGFRELDSSSEGKAPSRSAGSSRASRGLATKRVLDGPAELLRRRQSAPGGAPRALRPRPAGRRS